MGANNDFSIRLINYSPGPVSVVNFSPAFNPSGVATTSSDKVFMFGIRNDANKILAYDPVNNTEQDLTDDPALNVTGMNLIDDKLYLLGLKTTTNGLCDQYVGMKELNGGTSLFKTASGMWCDGDQGELIRF